MSDRIPFNRPYIVGKELYNISRAVIENSHIAGGGGFTKLCQQWLETTLGSPRSLLTHSCTGALEMAAILCGIEPGDEVIMPSFTFVSTANAFALRGGVPVFVDIRPDTLNMDESLLEAAITDRTKAIVPVHYAGVPCAMDEILSLARDKGIFVVEDAAQGLLSTYKGKFLGTLGDLGCLSFHETKNIISGEGGSLLINNEDMLERAEIVWEKGTDRQRFFRGQVDKYTWKDLGSSFQPSDMIAAFLYAQFELAQSIIASRCALFNLYYRELSGLEQRGCLRRPYLDDHSTCNGHIFYIVARSLEERSRLVAYLAEHGVNAVFHYVPLHSSPAGRKYGRASGELAVTDDLSDRLLRLPCFHGMREDEVLRVVELLEGFYKG